MTTIYGIKNCNKIRNTIEWMERYQRTFKFHDVKKTPLTMSELQAIAEKVGIDLLLNRRGTTWRKLGLSDKTLTEQELLLVAHENQSMLIRPLLQRGESFLVGYDEDSFETFTR